MKLVLDTTILVAAIRSSAGASRQLLLSALDEVYIFLASVPLVLEYEAVLTRPEHLAASGLNMQDVSDLLDSLISVARPVRLAFVWRPMLRDPNDDMVLEAAVNGQADAIVTFNRKDFNNVSPRFGIDILSPGEALKRIKTR